MKIVLNRGHGGFGLSLDAAKWLAARGQKNALEFIAGGDQGTLSSILDEAIDRSDPLLVECVETLGEAANDNYAQLEVKVIPDGHPWKIRDHEGMETVDSPFTGEKEHA